jgi:hypothetical protein
MSTSEGATDENGEPCVAAAEDSTGGSKCGTRRCPGMALGMGPRELKKSAEASPPAGVPVTSSPKSELLSVVDDSVATASGVVVASDSLKATVDAL